MSTFDELAATFDPDPNRRGKQFERLVKWWLETDPEYRIWLRKVWHWADWPDNDGADLGIDLVAEAHDGGVWAIQAKCTRSDLTVSKREVDSFFAASGRTVFTHRLLVTTAEELGRNVLRIMQPDQHVKSGVVTRSALLASEVDWPKSLDDMASGARHVPKKPRPDQVDAIDAVARGFETTDRGQLIMACGTGKTLTALWIAERLASRTTLVLVPSLLLLKAALADWTANANEPFTACAVCSDETVTSIKDPGLAHTAELGIPVTTDADKMADFLARPDRQIMFATYQSSPKIAESYAHHDLPPFDLVIADEAHRLVGPANSQFTTILDNAAISANRRLFMTATPRYFTGRAIKEAGESDFEVASMDDTTKFGQVLYQLNFSEAIRRSLLSDYQVAVVVIDDPTYRAWARDRRFVTRDGVVISDAGTLASQIGLAKAMHNYGLRRIISFHHTIKNAADFARTLPDVIEWMPEDARPAGVLHCEHLNGKMTADKRRTALDRLGKLDDADRGLIANARCLSEGVDVPALDGVAFIDPKRSRVDIIQAVGRAIRKSPDKAIGTIVIPVFVEHLDDAEIALDNSAFKPIWDVVSALRDQDDELAEQLDALRRQLAREKGPVKLPDKIILDVPATIRADFATAFDTALIIRATPSFEEGLGRLEAYVAEHGHARVPQQYVTADGYPLGRWVLRQRIGYRSGGLDADRTRRLEELPGWIWDANDDRFEQGFAQVEAYVAEHGNARVSARFVTADGYSLGKWVSHRRDDYRAGRLDADRTRQLQDLPGWIWDANDNRFEQGFAQVEAYVAEHGHARVPQQYVTADGYPLGNWVSHRRNEYRAGGLDADRIRGLEELPGWIWDTDAERFEEGFAQLEAYVAEHGHARVPQRFVTADGYSLGQWIGNRRDDYRAGRLDVERIRRLENLRGWIWDANDDRFEQSFAHLEAYVAEHGNARVSARFVTADGYSLGQWVSSRRDDYRAGRLDADRTRQLQDLPGWIWDANDDRFEQSFADLEAYVAEQGHARVTKAYVTADGFLLGEWVRRRRSDYRAGRLDAERIRRLENLRGWSWHPHDARFENGLAHLEAYAKREGHADVPQAWKDDDGFPLGSWSHRRRSDKRGGRLNDDRIARLEALPGWTW